MDILAWLNPCMLANAVIIASMALVLIIALLRRKESRCDIFLLSIPFFPLVPCVLEIIIYSHQ